MNLHPHPLTGTHIRLEPITPAHHDELRAALDCDPENWAIQVASARGEHWAGWWEALRAGQAATAPGAIRHAFAVRVVGSGALAGTSSFLFVDERHGTLEIGATWFRPEHRGTGVNVEAKLLMLGEAFGEEAPPPSFGWSPSPSEARGGSGMERVAFRVDARNARSLAAMAKMGAVREGTARHDFRTWTGHRRSSVVFSVIAAEWPAVRAGLEARLAGRGPAWVHSL